MIWQEVDAESVDIAQRLTRSEVIAYDSPLLLGYACTPNPTLLNPLISPGRFTTSLFCSKPTMFFPSFSLLLLPLQDYVTFPSISEPSRFTPFTSHISHLICHSLSCLSLFSCFLHTSGFAFPSSHPLVRDVSKCKCFSRQM